MHIVIYTIINSWGKIKHKSPLLSNEILPES